MNAFAFIYLIEKALKGHPPMRHVSRRYRLDSQLPFYRIRRHHKDGKGVSELNLGRRSLIQWVNILIDMLFQLAYAVLRLVAYATILIVVLRALQIPEYLIQLWKTLHGSS